MNPTRRSRPLAAGFALLAVCVAAAVLVAPSGGATAPRPAKAPAFEIGATPSSPNPTCPTPSGEGAPPEKSCQAMGRVTGFQTSADGVRNPFRIREPGRIVAWAVDISEPSQEEQTFFEDALANSGPPSARLSVLKPRDDGSFKLVKQSPVVQLSSTLGTRTVYTLVDPLKVREGLIVALTTPTWLSNLADFGASESDSWRASREEGQCLNEEDLLERSRPQQKVGGNRRYDCTYEGARLLYWAYLAPRGGSVDPE